MKFYTIEEYRSWQKPDFVFTPENEVRPKYRKYYKSNKHLFPKSVDWVYRHSFHDADLISIDTYSDSHYVINLDLDGSFHDQDKQALIHLTGVSEVCIPDGIGPETIWQYEEFHPHPNGFEFGVLFCNPLCELKIIAKDIKVEYYKPSMRSKIYRKHISSIRNDKMS